MGPQVVRVARLHYASSTSVPILDPDEGRKRLQAANLPAAVHVLAEQGEFRTYRKGGMIVEEGDAGEILYIVVEGRIKAFTTGQNGRELVYGVYGPGDYVGEMSLDGGPRSASVMALEPTLCACIKRETLRSHITHHPEFAFELIDRVIRGARIATEYARSMALMDVYTRVTRLLDSLAVLQDDGTRLIEERLTHADIAGRVGCSREMVSRLLKDLASGGYIRNVGRRLRILKPLPNRW